MKSKITSLTRPSHFTLPLSNIVLQFTHPHQPGSIQEMLRSPHASELALHQCERGRGLRCTLRTRRRLCGGGLPRRATLRCRWLRRRLRRRLRSAADAARAPCEEDPTWPDRRDGRRSRYPGGEPVHLTLTLTSRQRNTSVTQQLMTPTHFLPAHPWRP